MSIQRTIEDWNARGYRVLRGSMARGRSATGKALFSDDQVWKPKSKPVKREAPKNKVWNSNASPYTDRIDFPDDDIPF